jgi:hypothetical protein
LELSLHLAGDLAPGTAACPDLGQGALTLRIGTKRMLVQLEGEAPAGQLHLARDLWDSFSLPYQGIRLRTRWTAAGEAELGPSVLILYGAGSASAAEMMERAVLYFGHLAECPGLFGLGWQREIDWESGTIEGWVVDNRSGAGLAVQSRMPIPAVVRLTWSHGAGVIARLVALTGGLTFNANRNLSKWQFYDWLSGEAELRDHLPETVRYRGRADLAAMLVRHGTVYAKSIYSIRGTGVARIRSVAGSFEVSHIESRRQVTEAAADIAELEAILGRLHSKETVILQEGVPIIGLQGRALDFRIITVRDRAGGWQVPFTAGKVASNHELVITNVANGAYEDEDVEAVLTVHCGLAGAAARSCLEAMADLCVRASTALAARMDPVGIFGYDVAVEPGTGRLWLLEANTVPGWKGYSATTVRRLARSQADYALFLSGFPEEEGRHAR